MKSPTKSTADLLAVLGEDMRQFRHGLSGRWSGAAQKLRRRLGGGGPESSGAVTTPNTKPELGLLALLKDDIRQSLGALFGELNRLRGDKIGPPLERHQGEGVTTSESPESVKGPDH
jgi:hypothetical protein